MRFLFLMTEAVGIAAPLISLFASREFPPSLPHPTGRMFLLRPRHLLYQLSAAKPPEQRGKRHGAKPGGGRDAGLQRAPEGHPGLLLPAAFPAVLCLLNLWDVVVEVGELGRLPGFKVFPACRRVKPGCWL